MGFFKDFTDDLSEAVDELIPGSELEERKPADVKEAHADDILDTDMDPSEELSKLDGLLERVPDPKSQPAADVSHSAGQDKTVQTQINSKQTKENTMDANTKETVNKDTQAMGGSQIPKFESEKVSDENAVITSGMKITGDLESTGSIEVEGTINGNVRCNGKLTVTGIVTGNSTSSEFFADSAKIEGEVASSGTVKIGVGSVVIGNITASSAVIAGAVKGDIDVQGPVVVDTSAVVMGNIKSRSVQINNGAVIEGFCSQAYAEVDVASVFA